MAVLTVGRPVDPSTQHYRALEGQALQDLIALYWVIGEAAARGVAPSDREVLQRLRQKEAYSFPAGVQELRAFLTAAGQTVADLEYEARTELASAKLTAIALKAVSGATPTEAIKYYRAHAQQYAIPLRRDVLITNRKSAAEASRLKAEAQGQKGFAPSAQRETVELPSSPHGHYGRHILDRAIAMATPGRLSGPVKERVDYFIFVVTRVLPPAHRTFSEVEGSIESQLTGEARHRALASFVAAFRRKWRASTSCLSGYVVQKCRHYAGRRAPEETLGFK
jgi:hypothetical protein